MRFLITIFAGGLWLWGCAGSGDQSGAAPMTIAFGSCGYQDHPQPILAQAAARRPDLFVFLGDNIYGDTYDMDTLRAKYARLGAKPEFQALWDSATVLATWDDHDYGWNDSGRHYPYKNESKAIFLEFWRVPEDDPRREREGIYGVHYLHRDGRSLQVILLDLRTFRDDLRPYRGELVEKEAFFYQLDYWPYDTPDSTLMGEAQWRWLEEQLRQPADVRVVATGTQFGITYNGYEAWANFPHEQRRFIDLIKKTRAEGLIFISGDVHYAEISRLNAEGCYPLYDITSSGITSTWDFATPNGNRLDGPVMENNFGLLEIDWNQPDPLIHCKVYDVNKQLRIHRQVRLSELQFE
jgi:alkaline phosphatase D